MEWLVPAVIGTLTGSTVLFIVYAYLYRQQNDKFLGTWTIGWGFYAGRFVFLLFSLIIVRHQTLLAANQLCALWSAYFMLKGSFQFSGRSTPRWWLLVSIANSIWILGATFGEAPFMWLALPTFSFLALVTIWTGRIFLRFGALAGLGAKIVGFSFIIWGLHKFDYPFMQPVVWFAPWGYLLGSILALVTSIGIILVYFQKTKTDLIQSEERYRQTFEANQAIKLILDPQDGSIFDANQAACDFYGYSRAEMITKTIFDFNALPPEEVKARMAVVKDGGPASFSFPHRLASGAIRDVEVFSGSIEFQGRMLLNSIVFDVTERKRAEDALKESEEKFRNFSEQSMVGIYLIKDGVFIYVNPKFAEIFGYSVQECMDNMPFSRLVHPDELALADEKTRRRTFGEGDISQHQIRGLTKEGLTIHLDVHGSAIRHRGELAAMGVVLDITERKKSTEALREREEKFRNLFDNAEVGMFRTRVDGSEILDFNEKFLEIFGYSRHEMLGSPAIIHWADPGEREEMIDRLESEGRVKDFECGMLNKQGEVRQCLTSLRLFSDQGILEGSIIDITERKKAEEELRASEEHFHSLFNNMLNGYAYCRMRFDQGEPRDFIYLDVNKAFETLTGLKDVKGRWVSEVIPGIRQSDPELFKLYGQVALSGAPAHFERHVKALDMWFSVSVYCPRKEHFVAVFDVITERKRAEAELRASEERNRRILHSAMDGFWRLDAQTRILEVNEAYCRMSGYSEKELLTMHIKDLDAQEPPNAVAERVKQIIQNGSDRFLTKHHRKDGSLFDVEVSINYEAGTEDGEFAVFLRDITEQRRIEAQLRQAQKMEAIGTLAGGIAHDFNNILGAMFGFAEMALDSVKGSQDPTADIQEIIKAGGRAKDLVRQILTFSRKVEVDLKPLNLNHEVERAVRLLGNTIPKMIDIEIRLAEDLRPVLANANQIEQILLNLGSNARDSMPDGGRLVLETRNISLDQEFCTKYLDVQPGDFVLLQVSDTGLGMDKYTREHIFDPFFTTKETGKGTGLGLATAFGIVKSFGGEIACYSEPEAGTTFRIYLPAYQQDIPDAVEDSENLQEPSGGTETILLVDDEDALRDLGSRILAKAGYKVITANCGEEALAVYERGDNDFDLVILDLSMPGMGGRKALEAILEINPKARVVIVSGYSVNGSVKEVLRSGAVRYVPKPYNKAELLSAIRNVLDKT